MQGDDDEPDEIRRLIRQLGEAGGRLSASQQQVVMLRDCFGRRVLRAYVDEYILGKYRAHVEDDRHWPDDTTPEEDLESLRQTVLDRRNTIYLADTGPDGEWTTYFIGRVRRAWRGPSGSNRLLVIFNADHHRFVTGFQPDDDDDYLERQGGFWLRET